MKKSQLPKLQLHKASGRGVVRLSGKDHYCGQYGSPECEREYNRLIAEWLVRNPLSASKSSLTVGRLLDAYLEFARQYYTDPEGNYSRSLPRCIDTAKKLNALYHDTLAEQFTPTKFRVFKKHLIAKDLCRRSVNHILVMVRRIFKWAAAEEMIPETVYRCLALVPNIRFGREEARESPPVKPVEESVVEATIEILPPVLADMVRIQFLTGMRPGEVCRLRPCDLDRSDKIWVYSPHKHKTRWRQKIRQVPIGPKAQVVLEPYLQRTDDAYCFSPKERIEQFRLTQRSDRKSKVQPSQQNRSKEKPKIAPGSFYTTGTFGHAILGVIRRENAKRAAQGIDPIPEWSPNRLRHSAGTKIRAVADLETARIVLGHRSATTTEIYAELNLEKAKAIAEKIG